MGNKTIEDILEIILLFEKKNYNTGIEEEYLDRNIITINNRNNYYFEKLYKKFISTETKLISFSIKELILNSQRTTKNHKKRLFVDFLEILFSFKYDFNKFIYIKNFIPFFTNRSKEEFIIYEKTIKKILPLIKGAPNEFEAYKFIFKYSPFINNIFIFHYEIMEFKMLMKKYLNQLVFKWEEDCDFSELTIFINKNIFLFSKLLIDIKDSLEGRKNKINFFFDIFINELNPVFRDKFLNYKQLALEYTNNYNDDDNFYYDLNYEVYISLMLIFIRLKYGKYNPQVLYAYITHYKKGDYVFSLFLKSFFKNNNKKDILYHFFLMDSNLLSLIPDSYKGLFLKRNKFYYYKNYWQENILIFLLFSQSKLRPIEFSLVFEYIKIIINNSNKKNDNIFKESFSKLFEYISFGISLEQNKEIFNLINDTLFNKKNRLNYFCFLNIDTILYTEDNIRHKIKVLKEISFYFDKIEFIIDILFKNKVNERTIENLVIFLKLLKKEKDSLCNCINNNRIFLKIFLHFLLKSYYNIKIIQSLKKPELLTEENAEAEIIKEEIFNFFDFYIINFKSKNEYILDLAQIFFSIYQEFRHCKKPLNSFLDRIYNKIIYNKIQILFDYNSLNISFIKSILENTLLMFLLFFCYIIEDKTFHEEEYEMAGNKEKEMDNKYLIKDESEKLYNYRKYNFIFKEEEVSLFLNVIINSIINKNVKGLYEKYFPLLYNLKSITLEIRYKKDSLEDPPYFNRSVLIEDRSGNNIYFTFVFIYIKQCYPKYDPSFLLHIFYKLYKFDYSKKFFFDFIRCITDKENQGNILAHLFLEKKEAFLYKNKTNKLNIIELTRNWSKKHIFEKNYILKHLLNLNYSKNSFFYKYIDKRIEKSIKKNKMKDINYIVLYYTKDKNREIYNKIVSNFIQSKNNFYSFLEYDKELNSEQNMIKTIKLLENLSKYTSNSSENIENTKIEKEEDEENSDKLKIDDNKSITENNISEDSNPYYNGDKKSYKFNFKTLRFEKLKNKKQKRDFLFLSSFSLKNYQNILMNLNTFFKIIKREKKKFN